MKNRMNLLWLPLVFLLLSMTADKPAYQYFTTKGKKISFEKMLTTLQDADVVFFGELHNNAMSHWMELEIARALAERKGDKLRFGAEMLEADQQLLLDEYINGQVPAKNFEQQARLWPNYKTDYAPILKVAADHHIPFIATNIPRRYAAVVNKGGFEALNTLSEEAKSYIAPLPVKYDPEVNCYKQMASMMAHMPGTAKGASHIAEAQAIKDATMAHFILKNWKEGLTFFHFNGSYHSDNHEGIVWWLKQQNPGLKIVTITTLEQADAAHKPADEDLGRADFILSVDENITKTY